MKYNYPKIDLHLHLDGSILPQTAWELVQEQGIEVPAKDLESFIPLIMVPKNCKDVNECLERFEIPVQILQDKASLKRVTQELIDWLVKEGVAYAEIRFAPQLHTRGELNQRDAIDGVLAGREAALQEHQEIGIGIILCAMSIGAEAINMAENLETVRLTKEYLGKGVVALDLAGAEGIVPLSNFAPVFDLAREMDVPFTCHAGDSQGPETVEDALNFGAKRLGHGHHVYEDAALCQRAIQEGVTFEICPTSNVCCQSTMGYGEHYVKKMYDLGMRVTINTDNMTLFDLTLDKEYDHCIHDMGFTEDDILQMLLYAADASFQSQGEKESLKKRILACKKGA
ncbi:aminodeoxyfutalosine deaminase [Anaerotignum neopropionicum]|uniref:Aminodeoxyfutalosine deaminase n=1 Tax=Anaerotignum neopropionicum TaxID=36847 RepID=A0A136WBX6_9FIRM|nr:adenosine deaminase [Anaerotignum neopropionicum]KXL52023.1 aminodeoxyfutalosine deaminase [Anaerotignum neopropionicum]